MLDSKDVDPVSDEVLQALFDRHPEGISFQKNLSITTPVEVQGLDGATSSIEPGVVILRSVDDVNCLSEAHRARFQRTVLQMMGAQIADGPVGADQNGSPVSVKANGKPRVICPLPQRTAAPDTRGPVVKMDGPDAWRR